MSRRVTAVDLGAKIDARFYDLPERFAKVEPPPGTPPGVGERLWYGGAWTRKLREREYRVKNRRGEVALRIRATWDDDAFLGVYDGHMKANGALRALTSRQEQQRAMAERIRAIAVGQEQVDGVPSTTAGAMEVMKSAGLDISQSGHPIERSRKTSRPALPAVFWASMMTAAHMVWEFGSSAPGVLTKRSKQTKAEKAAGIERVTARIGIEDLLLPGPLLDWWVVASNGQRSDLAGEIMAHAVQWLDDPPPWHEWAGTPQRTAGWVGRSGPTHSLAPLPVVSWKGERCGVLAAVRRFVRQPVQSRKEEQLSLEI